MCSPQFRLLGLLLEDIRLFDRAKTYTRPRQLVAACHHATPTVSLVFEVMKSPDPCLTVCFKLVSCARLTRGWLNAICEYQHPNKLASPAAGARRNERILPALSAAPDLDRAAKIPNSLP